MALATARSEVLFGDTGSLTANQMIGVRTNLLWTAGDSKLCHLVLFCGRWLAGHPPRAVRLANTRMNQTKGRSQLCSDKRQPVVRTMTHISDSCAWRIPWDPRPRTGGASAADMTNNHALGYTESASAACRKRKIRTLRFPALRVNLSMRGAGSPVGPSAPPAAGRPLRSKIRFHSTHTFS